MASIMRHSAPSGEHLPWPTVPDLHPNARRFTTAARDLGLDIEVRTFPEGTKTAADAAAAIGVAVGQIVKSLIFAVDGDVVVAYVSGANQLDEKKLAAAAGADEAGRRGARPGRACPRLPVGRGPPLGRPRPVRALLRGGPPPLGLGGGGARRG